MAENIGKMICYGLFSVYINKVAVTETIEHQAIPRRAVIVL